jgi:hypothetical protein
VRFFIHAISAYQLVFVFGLCTTVAAGLASLLSVQPDSCELTLWTRDFSQFLMYDISFFVYLSFVIVCYVRELGFVCITLSPLWYGIWKVETEGNARCGLGQNRRTAFEEILWGIMFGPPILLGSLGCDRNSNHRPPSERWSLRLKFSGSDEYIDRSISMAYHLSCPCVEHQQIKLSPEPILQSLPGHYGGSFDQLTSCVGSIGCQI